jgi:ABC-type transport system substrate-binding protein
MLEGKVTEISGVKVIDDYTLEVTIDAPSHIPGKAAYPTIMWWIGKCGYREILDRPS